MNAIPRQIHNADLISLHRAIDRACAELQSIKLHAHPSHIRSIELQADSAQTYASYASEALPICGALIVDLIEIAGGLAERDLSRTEREDLTEFETAKDILQDIYGAAQRMVEEEEA
jgi:hypothetical protein